MSKNKSQHVPTAEEVVNKLERDMNRMYFTFKPRPDQPERYDEQESFYNSKLRGVSWLLGGNGCVSGDTLIKADGDLKPVSEIKDTFRTEVAPGIEGLSCRPFIKGVDDLYRVDLSNGESFTSTLDHRVLSGSGQWLSLRDIRKKDSLLSWKSSIDGFNSFELSNPGEFIQTPLGIGYTHLLTATSDISNASANELWQEYKNFQYYSGYFSVHSEWFDSIDREAVYNNFNSLMLLMNNGSLKRMPCHNSDVVYVENITWVKKDEFWDMHVPVFNTYTDGSDVFHHNSGTTTLSLAKMVKFLLRDQPPPRPATPFWVISEGYPMVMDVAWNEKLYGRGLLPVEEVQWDKIDWYKPNQNWPFRIPLKPWPGHDPNNYWVIELKSYDQGRSKMQASSIGGFCFIEQCPFELIEEVLRGCRDYNFPGSKIVEFTPIDPHLSRPLEDMINNGTLPDDWGVFYCNTQCAMEAGHVSKEWFNEFFGLVSEDMREVRMRGAFASFEGLIYPSFNQRIHTDINILESLPKGVRHFRAIDWGSGPENAFVCIFGAKDSIGNWSVYDEYYSTDQSMTYLDHAERIKAKHHWTDDPWHCQTYGDPASPGLARLFAQAGIPVTSANNQVLEGIESVRLALQLQNGDPKLLIDREKCKNLVREMQTYTWESGNKNTRNRRDAAPRPRKYDDHAVDALRYLIHSNNYGKSRVYGRKIEPKNKSRFVR